MEMNVSFFGYHRNTKEDTVVVSPVVALPPHEKPVHCEAVHRSYKEDGNNVFPGVPVVPQH